MRPNAIGWFLVALFGLGGLVFWAVIPGIWIGQIWVAVSVFLAVLYTVMNRVANRAAGLAKDGIRGQAHILAMSQTGTYVNNQPRVKLRLRIEAPGVAPFEDDDTVTVPMIALGTLRIGGTLAVALDPEDPTKYMIDWFGNAGGPPMTFSLEDGRTVNLANDPATTAQVMEVLRRHGMAAASGQLDIRQNPQARSEVLDVLQRSGHLGGPPAGGPGVAGSAAEDADPAARLAQLTALRATGQITNEEFEEHRRRILSDI